MISDTSQGAHYTKRQLVTSDHDDDLPCHGGRFEQLRIIDLEASRRGERDARLGGLTLTHVP